MGDLTVRLTTRLERGETILFLVLVMLALPSSASANTQGALHRAGLVVRFGNGSVTARCVTFSEPSLAGLELLMRAGLSIVVDLNSSIGAGVCKIGTEGCDRGKSCFCQCEGSTCAYWQYFHLQAERGEWKYSNLGASVYTIADGAVEGWAWGNNVAPPVMTLDRICASAPPAQAPTNAQITRAPTSVPTATPQPVTPTIAPTLAPAAASTIPETAPTALPTTSVPSATVPPASPTVTPASPTAAPTVSAAPQHTGASSPFASYALFGVIVLGLGTWLAIQAWRKAR
jgi:hypothetical protein